MHSDRTLIGALVLVTVFAVSLLGYDIWQLATGTVDLNKHIPLMVPLALGSIVACGVVVIRHDRPARAAVFAHVRKDSAFHSENLPTERAAPAHIE
ncbi:hypothetical protein HZA85_03960 [Candidatus Uhrbacteria bacterium]|nr:hypothetical protein [Candidatus Uhrbacteria bacterium]